MYFVKRLILVIPLWVGVQTAPLCWSETWTDITGKHNIEAKFLSASGGNIYLEKADGSRIAVPINKLSPASLEQAKRLYQAAQSGAGSTAAEPMPVASATSGTSKLGANPTAQETADVLSVAMAEFDVATIWDAFPQQHQQDIEELVRLAANSIDSQMWDGVASILKKVSRLFIEKKEFFLNNETIGGNIPINPHTDEIWDATAEMLAAYANSMITDQEAMKNFSMNQFIANDVPKLRAAFSHLRELTEKMKQENSPFGQMVDMPQIEIVSESANQAVFKVTTNGKTKEDTFVKSGNRWIPQEMAEDWEKGMAEAKAGLAKLATPEGKQGMGQAQMILMMASGPLDQLLAADTQQDFDQVVENVAGMAMGMMMGGGPGGPPPGFGPGGPPPGGPPPGFGPEPDPDGF